MAISENASKMLIVAIKNALDCLKIPSITRAHVDLELPVSRWNLESHTFVIAWGEFRKTLEDVLNLMGVTLYGEMNAMGMRL